ALRRNSVGVEYIDNSDQCRRRSTHGNPNFSLQKCFTALPNGAKGQNDSLLFVTTRTAGNAIPIFLA
ncbi:MAG: hypothetical protein WCJ09_21355, partial [Planctomycetota bacterium]